MWWAGFLNHQQYHYDWYFPQDVCLDLDVEWWTKRRVWDSLGGLTQNATKGATCSHVVRVFFGFKNLFRGCRGLPFSRGFWLRQDNRRNLAEINRLRQAVSQLHSKLEVPMLQATPWILPPPPRMTGKPLGWHDFFNTVLVVPYKPRGGRSKLFLNLYEFGFLAWFLYVTSILVLDGR